MKLQSFRKMRGCRGKGKGVGYGAFILCALRQGVFALVRWWEVGVRDKRTGVTTEYLTVWKQFWRRRTTVNEITSKVHYVLL
jgi:hypothetical protein